MKKILIYVCLLVVSFFGTSCSLVTDNPEDDDKKTNLIIIAGLHSNSKKMDVEEDLEEKVKDIYSNFGEIRVIVVDGKPEVAIGSDGMKIGRFEGEYLRKSQETKQRSNRIWERDYLTKQTQSFLEEFKKLEPDESEVNTLGAIIEAVNILKSFSQEEGEVNNEIIIYDTGLCTSGRFSFRDNEWADLLFYNKELKDERIQPLVESLKSKKLIPNLSGIKLTWYGIGKTAEPQTELEPNHLDNLKRIWWNILKTAEAVPPSGIGDYDYFFQIESQGKAEYPQKVTPIEKKKIGNPPQGQIQPTTLPIKKLGFKRESSKFLSKEKAVKALKPYAERIKMCSNEKILLIGTTSDPKRNGGDLVLSRKRAKKVKKILVQLGVSKNQLKIYGWAASSSLYDSSEWVGNNYKEKVAKRNRAVHLMPKESEYAQELLRQKHP